uniref:Uncharacterized protein n=1 Tax=Panagrolaimus sp. ES5 TaxID=591445 RepID=A0AC34FFY6_9BILA
MLAPWGLPADPCHRYGLYLGINQNNDPSVEPSGIMIEQIENLPSTLGKIVSSKVPVIDFFDNSSVICIWNTKKNCYEFAEKWNGLYGKDLFLSFEDKTPKLTDKFATKRSSVVYDLLEILATPEGKEIKVDPDWEFKIVKKEDGTVLIEYDTLSGIQTSSTPNYLMTLLSRWEN